MYMEIISSGAPMTIQGLRRPHGVLVLSLITPVHMELPVNRGATGQNSRTDRTSWYIYCFSNGVTRRSVVTSRVLTMRDALSYIQ